MQRNRIIFLSLVLLFSQFVLTIHTSQHHDKAHVCELCVFASHQDQALISALQFIALILGLSLVLISLPKIIRPSFSLAYSVRAPPQIL